MPDRLAGFFGFAILVAYWPGIGGLATTPRWDVGAGLAVALFFCPRIRLTAAHWVGLALLVWLFVSLAWSEGWLDGVNEMFQLLIIATAFAVGSALARLDGLVMGAALGVGVSSGIAIAQWCGWHGLEQLAGGTSGLFYNKDTLAAVAALVMIATVAFRRWALVPLLLPPLLLTGSRAAWLAMAAPLLFMRFKSERLTWSLRLAAAAAIILPLALRDPASSSERIMIWRDTIANLTFFGHGLGSFREVFLQHAHFFNIAVQHSRPEHPHNEWLWLGFEGGIPAFLLGLVLACLLWRASEEHPERAVLVGLSVLSLFAMPFHDPATVLFASLCAGHLAGRAAAVCGAAVDRRSPVCAGLVDPERAGRPQHA